MSKEAAEPHIRAFFVGYSQLSPRGQRRWLVCGGGLIGLSALVAVVFAGLHKPPAPFLRPEQPAEFAGYFLPKPYPHLQVQEASGPPRIILLAGGGKGGIADGQRGPGPVRVRGRLLERQGTRLLSDAAIAADPRGAQQLLPEMSMMAPQVWVEEVMGEIIDPKCAFGRMLPGRGAAHRACAQMCIRGGVPPIFFSLGAHGIENHLLLVSPEGESAASLVLPYVGERVRVRGSVQSYGDLQVLTLAKTDAIRPL